jgi:hypothetical protein
MGKSGRSRSPDDNRGRDRGGDRHTHTHGHKNAEHVVDSLVRAAMVGSNPRKAAAGHSYHDKGDKDKDQSSVYAHTDLSLRHQVSPSLKPSTPTAEDELDALISFPSESQSQSQSNNNKRNNKNDSTNNRNKAGDNRKAKDLVAQDSILGSSLAEAEAREQQQARADYNNKKNKKDNNGNKGKDSNDSSRNNAGESNNDDNKRNRRDRRNRGKDKQQGNNDSTNDGDDGELEIIPPPPQLLIPPKGDKNSNRDKKDTSSKDKISSSDNNRDRDRDRGGKRDRKNRDQGNDTPKEEKKQSMLVKINNPFLEAKGRKSEDGSEAKTPSGHRVVSIIPESDAGDVQVKKQDNDSSNNNRRDRNRNRNNDSNDNQNKGDNRKNQNQQRSNRDKDQVGQDNDGAESDSNAGDNSPNKHERRRRRDRNRNRNRNKENGGDDDRGSVGDSAHNDRELISPPPVSSPHGRPVIMLEDFEGHISRDSMIEPPMPRKVKKGPPAIPNRVIDDDTPASSSARKETPPLSFGSFSGSTAHGSEGKGSPVVFPPPGFSVIASSNGKSSLLLASLFL